MKCSAVIFSRVSPFQKALIVALVKKQPGTMTLAIGDGANDVGMLQEAHVGIGVKGREGSQAAQASDFAIPRFRCLIPLMAVQGRWAVTRLTHVAILMLYKNFAMIMVYFWSAMDCLQSPTDFYDEFLISFFNLFFTLLPPVAFGFFERDFRKSDLLKYPQLYRRFHNPMQFPSNLIHFGIGLWQSILVYYVVRLSGPEDALQTNGNLSYICIVVIIACQFLFWAADWNGWSLVASCLTVIFLFMVVILYAYGNVPSLIGMVHTSLGSLRGWIVIALTLIGGIMPGVMVKFFRQLGWPTLERLVSEREVLDQVDTLDFDELLRRNPVFDRSQEEQDEGESGGSALFDLE
jgi:phospholipid-transporting ATPase